jgi:hypothetical protein
MVGLAHRYRMPATWLVAAYDEDPWLMNAQAEYAQWHDAELVRLSKQPGR